jgi:MFS transporter, NNP family, nitrate/nitrite transporter
MAWFSVAPLMPAIKKSLHLTKMDIAYGNLASVSITILARIIMGPLVDKYGPKTTFCCLLVIGAIPVMCVGSINSFADLILVR